MKLFEEPYRLFFPLGVLMGLTGTGHWLLYGLGVTEAYSSLFHGLLQTGLFMGFFATGFLMTAIPRFSATRPASPAECTASALAAAGAFAALLAWRWVLAEAFLALFMTLTFIFIIRRARARGRGAVQPPVEFIWIPFALLNAITGYGLLIASQMGRLSVFFGPTGLRMATQGFLLCLVLGVGSFLGARLLGIQSAGASRRRFAAQAAAAVLLTASWFLETAIGDPVRAALATALLASAGILTGHNAAGRTLFSVLLRASFFFVVLGLWAVSFLPASRSVLLHLVFIGGFGLMTFSVATMVIFSHSGHGPRLSEGPAALKIVAAGIPLSLALRLSGLFVPEHYFALMAAAGACWILFSLAWLGASARYLWAGGPESFDHERLKEAARHRAC